MHEAHATTRPRGAPRYSLEALRRAMGWPPLKRMAIHLGEHPRQMYRWLHDGLNEWKADELACRIGVHPATVWPEWLQQVEPW